jgi:hypothetical protein
VAALFLFIAPFARVAFAPVVVSQFFAGLDTFNAGNDPDLIIRAQHKAVRSAAAMIDPRRTVALIEPVDTPTVA